MDHVLKSVEQYAANLEQQVNERTTQLIEEKKRSDVLLYRMLPRYVYWIKFTAYEKSKGLYKSISGHIENFLAM